MDTTARFNVFSSGVLDQQLLKPRGKNVVPVANGDKCDEHGIVAISCSV